MKQPSAICDAGSFAGNSSIASGEQRLPHGILLARFLGAAQLAVALRSVDAVRDDKACSA